MSNHIYFCLGIVASSLTLNQILSLYLKKPKYYLILLGQTHAIRWNQDLTKAPQTVGAAEQATKPIQSVGHYHPA